MKPDDERLAQWVEDELDAGSAAEVERWAATQPEWLERREQARWSRGLLGESLGGEVEVPHAEFFNARIRREIEVRQESPAARSVPRSRLWLMPATAAAGMALGFFLGHERQQPERETPITAEMTPLLYTPEKGVEAEYVGGEQAAVIVLAGVQAIPDEWEIPETVMLEPKPSRMVSRDGKEREDVQ